MGLPDVSRKLSAEIHERLAALSGISDGPVGLTRTFLSPALERAKAMVAGWMEEAGLQVFEDRMGNLIGRRDCGNPEAPTVACGSHLDTVRNAGSYDGALGVVAGIQAAAELREMLLPYHLEIVAFSDEEGVRFQSTYLGSRFYAGDETIADVADANRISLAEALAGHRPAHPSPPPRKLAVYVETHIEQGPVLEAEVLPLAVVSGIAGQTRAKVALKGLSGHAGTVPMPMRMDALAGAAECMLLTEKRALDADGLVATVGELHIASPASNVIPGTVSFSLDIRDLDDEKRKGFVRDLFEEIRQIAMRRRLECVIETKMDSAAVRCDAGLRDELAELVKNYQGRCPILTSGAGHDAVALAQSAKVAMLFVRCREGLSHHPDEFAAPEDIDLAVKVLTNFLATYAPGSNGGA